MFSNNVETEFIPVRTLLNESVKHQFKYILILVISITLKLFCNIYLYQWLFSDLFKGAVYFAKNLILSNVKEFILLET